MTEVRTMLTADDFDEGDRVYFKENGKFSLGTITSIFIEPYENTILEVVFGNGEEKLLCPPCKGLGKVLPVKDLAEDVVISYWDFFTATRQYYRVQEYFPGELLVMQIIDGSSPPWEIMINSAFELETRLLDWEIEG